MYPKALYRYRRVTEHSLNEIRFNSAYFCPLSDLNDYAEGSFDIGPEDIDKVRQLLILQANADKEPDHAELLRNMPVESLHTMARHIMERAQSEYLDAQKLYGVVCFSERYDNEMMWGHYADSGEGFVIEYNLRGIDMAVGALQKVVYSDRPGVTSLSSALDPANAGRFVELVSVKKKCWEHEEEWRFLLLDEMTSRVIRLPFPISRVITGPKCCKDNLTRIANAVVQHGSARFAQGYIAQGPNRTLEIHDPLSTI